MVPAPMLTSAPTSASPMYDRCDALAPSPNTAFFVSTKLPTFTCRPSFVPGRRCAYGPTAASSSMTASSETTRRSEEHTSELQSRGHLVCRLLLEKKKKKKTTTQSKNNKKTQGRDDERMPKRTDATK